MTDRTAAAVLLLQKAVLDELTGAHKDARSVLGDDMRPGDAVAPDGPSGLSLGRVRMDKPRTSATVVDEAAFIQWVVEHAPHQVETVQQVRPAFRRAVLAAKGVLPDQVDEATGEIVTVEPAAGVALTAAAQGVLVVTPSEDARILARVMVAGLPEQIAGAEREAVE